MKLRAFSSIGKTGPEFPGRTTAGRGAGPDGFTLIELLVVIAIIGILAALLLPVLSSAKQRALRIACLSNVKQVDLCFIEYATDNNDRLPYNPWISQFANFEAMDDPLMASDPLVVALRKYIPNPDTWGCPANRCWYIDKSTHRAGMPYVAGMKMWGIDATNRNETIRQELIWVQTNFGPGKSPGNVGAGNYAYTDTSKRVLVADNSETGFFENDPKLWQTYDWTALTRVESLPGFQPNETYGFFRTDHVNTMGKVTGSNDGMLDGHAQWVKARDLKPCSTRLQHEEGFASGGMSATLWW